MKKSKKGTKCAKQPINIKQSNAPKTFTKLHYILMGFIGFFFLTAIAGVIMFIVAGNPIKDFDEHLPIVINGQTVPTNDIFVNLHLQLFDRTRFFIGQAGQITVIISSVLILFCLSIFVIHYLRRIFIYSHK